MDENENSVYFYGATSNTFTLRVTDVSPEPPTVPSVSSALPSRSSSHTVATTSKGPSWSSLVKSNLPSSSSTAASIASSSNTVPSSTSSPPSQTSSTLCSFFLAGWCRSGTQCKFSHETANELTIQYFLQEIQKLRDNDKSKNISSSSSASSSTTTDEMNNEEFTLASQQWQATHSALRDTLLNEAIHLGYCSSLKIAEAGLQSAERLISKDIECGICLEKIMDQRGRRFGLLSHCTHAFCLDCIREWRAKIDLPTSTTRACPLCRTTSYYVIACDRYIADPSRKAALLEEVQTGKQTIPCKHWNYGRGECPFGSSCFYAHLNPDGTVYKTNNNHSFRMDANGTIKGGTLTYQLNQYLEESNGDEY